jgi:GAF domain-containing protein
MKHVVPHGLASQVVAAIRRAPDPTAAMTEAVTMLERDMASYTWVGVYRLFGNELVLGPYVGRPSPHTRIPLGLGICGAAAVEKATIIVDDVHRDARYLACSVDTRSEIVVPILRGDAVIGEIDVDSDQPAAFGPDDRTLLEAVAKALAERLPPAPQEEYGE